MKRALIFVLLTTLLPPACAPKQTGQPAGQAQPTTTGSAAGSSLAAAAAKVTDACSLVPTDLAGKLIPNASKPISEKVPLRCTVTNGTSVLEITVETGVIVPVEPVKGAEFISGLAEGGYLERPVPDDAYLTVILGKDPNGVLHVEVAGHDGKDHKDDSIAVAREILARLR